MSKHNRKCPECGASVVGVIFTDVKAGYEIDKDNCRTYWEDMGVCCSLCDWELQTTSSNS